MLIVTLICVETMMVSCVYCGEDFQFTVDSNVLITSQVFLRYYYNLTLFTAIESSYY